MNRIILITGEKNSGKTTYLKYFIHQVAIRENLPIGGFFTEGIFKSGRISGYDLIELDHHDKKLLCSNIPRKGWIKMGRFYFDPEGFRFGEQVLSNIPEGVAWIMIDEYGPMEISGKGWRKAIDQLLERNELTLMITIRVDLLNEAIEKFQGHEIHVFNISQGNFPQITSSLKKLMPW